MNHRSRQLKTFLEWLAIFLTALSYSTATGILVGLLIAIYSYVTRQESTR